ncbi:cytoplasmic dynein 2 light intermediate chain 1 [Phymastichus coffea]|uniref:cytoplasmic dynein 2 light intermediate chain 1 n=1 Tax=Phymastichus coffea TaxID=108790 RepID=UPI00273C4BDD|nr:cytoplasmic dynein 2 light intermediate chain 1 [Phymastichus coffea]
MTGRAADLHASKELALKNAMEEETRRKTDPNESHEKSLIVLGSKQVGKTTMIHRFLEKDDAPKPTLAIDYSYGRKAGKSLVKDVVHVWEIGQPDEGLIASALTGCNLSHAPHHITVVIVLDLGKPEVMWRCFEECHLALRQAIRSTFSPQLIQDMTLHKLKTLREPCRPAAESNNGEGREESSDLFPMRLCIVGGKYDQFRDFEGVDREFVCRTLRAVAHVLGATLHFHSAKDSQILRRTKELLKLYGFSGQTTKVMQMDYEKALSVPAGHDSVSSIDFRSSHDDDYAETLDAIKRIYTRRFPQSQPDASDDPEDDDDDDDNDDDPNFAEPIVDRLRVQREQEISVLLRDMREAPVAGIPVPDPF